MPSQTGKQAHLIGVAGVGMSALAQALCAAGYAVSGSDRFRDEGRDLEVLGQLAQAGVRLVPQDGSAITAQTAVVVVSTAIEADNSDQRAALRLGVPVVHRARMLAELVRTKECVAVTGTSGKTTVTGMLGWMLEAVGADPTVVNGGAVLNWASATAVGNMRSGHSALWVIEADESDRSLLQFHPDWAVITNISRDHFGLDETRALFETFRAQVRKGAVGALDTPEAARCLAPDLSAAGIAFSYAGVAFELPLLGRHNAENALSAIMLGERMGYGLEALRGALRSFRGIARRLEVVGRRRGITVIDDYAHNTAKIGAAWRAVRPHGQRLLAVWRPHGFAPLANMFDDLVQLFGELCRGGDQLWLLPVYYAGGTASRTVTSEQLAARLQASGVAARVAGDYDRLLQEVTQELRDGDVVLSMGARDPELPAFARRLAAQLDA